MPKLSPAYKCVSPLPPASARRLSDCFLPLSWPLPGYLTPSLSFSGDNTPMTNCCPALAAHSDAEERFRQWKQRAKLGEAGSPALPFVLLLLLLSFFFFTSLRFLLGESEASVKTWNRKKTEFQTDAGEPCLCLEQ